MEPKLVVCFRGAGGASRSFPDRGRALIERASAAGGTHVGWDVLRVTFAFAAGDLEAVLALLATPGADTAPDEAAWSVGVAQGEIEVLTEPGSPLLASGLLRWGPPLVAASMLAGRARPGEVLCAQTVPALRAGELLTLGMRVARDGPLRVRGTRLDLRRPLRRSAALDVGRLGEPPLVTSHLPPVELASGAVVVVRADPGGGGTRLLASVACVARRALVLSVAGSGHEPFGALRQALAKTSVTGDHDAGALASLMAGEGTSVDRAAELIVASLAPADRDHDGTTRAIVVDDARSIDPSTLAACGAAMKVDPSIAMIVRLDMMGSLPSALAALPRAAEHEVPPLTQALAEEIAAGATGGALDDAGRTRWAKLGGDRPLGVVAAVAHAIASGDLLWSSDGRLAPRTRSAGRGPPRAAADSIRARADLEGVEDRSLLSALAVAGGEANVRMLGAILEAVGVRSDLDGALARLQRAGWVARIEVGEGAVVMLPTRTHQRALYASLDEEARRRWHLALARAIEAEGGLFARVEAAWHKAQGGDGPRASPVLLEAAAKAAELSLAGSTTQLIGLARRVDPSCEDAALELLGTALERGANSAPSMPPPTTPSAPPVSIAPASLPSSSRAVPSVRPTSGPARVAAIASVPPQPRPSAMPPRATVPSPPIAASEPPHPAEEHDSLIEHAVILRPESMVARAMSAHPGTNGGEASAQVAAPGESIVPDAEGPGSQMAVRLGDLAREALLAGDNAALEHWVEGLRAAGGDDAFTVRMGAMARLARGDIGDALRVLRRTRSQLDAGDHRRRCQTSLALGVALSVAGRPQDALLEALDALARARQIDDVQGATACLAFLAKLYSSVSRDADAERLRRSSVGPPRPR